MTRSSPGKAERRRGATLIELSICAGLLALISVGIWHVMRAGLRYMQVTNATIEVQRGCMSALGRLTQELSEGSPDSFGTDGSSIVFGSPRDELGRLRFDASGRLMWQKMVVYYVEKRQDVPCLLRKERSLPRPAVKPPAPVATASLRDDDTLTPVVLASNVTRLWAAGDNPIDVSVTAQVFLGVASDPAGAGRREFKIRVDSKVTLKN